MIGIFDSGSGGLTVARAIKDIAPHADIVYFGDTLRAPYGQRSTAELEQLTFRMIRLLRTEGATIIVSACNSISAAVIQPMLDLFGVRDASIIEMMRPAIRELQRRGITEAAVLATSATVRSRLYVSSAAAQGIVLHPIPCPELAGMVEHNAPEAETREEIRRALIQIPSTIHTILLGCTHYPFVLPQLVSVAQSLARPLTFIDPAPAVAFEVMHRASMTGSGRFRALCSKKTPLFEHRAHAVAPHAVVEQRDLLD